MKRISTIIVAAACAGAMLVSCGKQGLTFRTITTEKTFEVAEGRSESLNITIDVDLPDQAKSAPETAAAVTDVIMEALFGNSFTGTDPEEAIDQWIEGLAAEYRETNAKLIEDLTKSGDEGPFASLSWENMKTGKVTSTFGDICTYTVSTYAFTGGAHGMSSEMNLNFDTKTGELIEQEDILSETNYDEIGALLAKHLNDGHGDDSKVEIYVDKIAPNGNFSIGTEGITFTFNQYEIAPYSFGIIDITIPADEIKPYLKADIYEK